MALRLGFAKDSPERIQAALVYVLFSLSEQGHLFAPKDTLFEKTAAMLTDTAVRNAKPGPKAIKIFDSGGLYLELAPSGGKWWRLKYRYQGKEKRLSLGTYPMTTLKEAREAREAAKKLLSQGVDPSAHRKQGKAKAIAQALEIATTFEVVARDWHAFQQCSFG